MKAFISYRDVEADRNLAGAIAESLRQHSVAVSMQMEIPLGASWNEYIDRELNDAGYFIVLVSQAAVQSDMVQEEIRVAHKLLKQQRLRILPIKISLEDENLPYELRAMLRPLQHAEWFPGEDPARVCQRVLEVVLGVEGLMAIMGDPTKSYSSVKRAFTTLASLTDWTARARESFAAYWDRRALQAAAGDDRDRCLLAWLSAAALNPADGRLREAADLVGRDGARLQASYRNLGESSGSHPLTFGFWSKLFIRFLPGGVPGLLAVAPKTRRIAAARAFGNDVFIFDTATGRVAAGPLRHESVLCAGFSPDEATLVTGGWDDTVRFWRSDTGEPAGIQIPHKGAVLALAFSPDGNTLLTCGRSRAYRWSAATVEPVGEPLKHKGIVSAVAFSADGSLFLTGEMDGTVRLWQAGDGAPGPVFRHAGYGVRAVFSPDGKFVLTGGADGKARLWLTASGEPLDVVFDHRDKVSAVAFHSSGKFVATASADGSAQVWSIGGGEPAGPALRHPDRVSACVFDPVGECLLTNGKDPAVRSWRVDPQTVAGRAMRHQGSIMEAAWSPDGSRIVSAGSDKTVRCWLAEKDAPAGPALTHDQKVASVRAAADPRIVYTVASDKTVRLWRDDSAEVLNRTGGTGKVLIAASPAEPILVVAQDSAAHLHDGASGSESGVVLIHDKEITAVAFSPDGKLIVTAGADLTLRIWSAAGGSPVGSPLQVNAAPNFVAVASGGSVVVAAASDTLRLLHAETAEVLGDPVKFAHSIAALAINEDATMAIVATRLWLHFFFLTARGPERIAARLLPGDLPGPAALRFTGGTSVQAALCDSAGLFIAVIDSQVPASEPLGGDPDALLQEWQHRLGLTLNEATGEFMPA